MTGKRLSELEREEAVKTRDAKRWLKKHESKLEPSVTDSHRVREQTTQDGHRVERLIRLGMWVDGEPRYDEGARFVPLISEPQEFDLKRAELGARVRHVLSFLPDSQRDILWQYYVEGMEWHELRIHKGSRQAVHERLAWARNRFLKAWKEHAEDTIDIKESDL